MNAGELLEAIDAHDETLSIGLPFEDRVRLAVEDVYSSFTDSTVAGLIRRAGLRYPNADLRRIDLLDECDPEPAAPGPARHLPFQRFTGSGKSYLGGALPRADRTARLGSGIAWRRGRK
ncbi:hypothetical protein E3T35_08890 [Cryobacterium sp. TMT1-2-2]|uniref:hypothetical protein n=1 Tax=Cryobacterium sp. TMT1-2-2 TaxID=1259233 RepID=UPI001069A85D|nr:hypothetical protein [Cryobacterium sp. TMT1-2-2]TFD11889.1 hypothetical protein E3T35_08890 [Cryobacterium sp. TMT1-2-2]